MTAIILASASPRRRELIHQIGWTAEIKKSHFQEVSDAAEAGERRKRDSIFLLNPFSGADLVCTLNALGKAEDVLKQTGKFWGNRKMRKQPGRCFIFFLGKRIR